MDPKSRQTETAAARFVLVGSVTMHGLVQSHQADSRTIVGSLKIRPRRRPSTLRHG